MVGCKISSTIIETDLDLAVVSSVTIDGGSRCFLLISQSWNSLMIRTSDIPLSMMENCFWISVIIFYKIDLHITHLPTHQVNRRKCFREKELYWKLAIFFRSCSAILPSRTSFVSFKITVLYFKLNNSCTCAVPSVWYYIQKPVLTYMKIRQ